MTTLENANFALIQILIVVSAYLESRKQRFVSLFLGIVP